MRLNVNLMFRSLHMRGGRREGGRREREGREESDNVTIMAGAKMQRVGIN